MNIWKVMKNIRVIFLLINDISRLISYLIAIQYYNIPLENYLNNVAIDTAKYFQSGDCDKRINQ